MLIYLFSNIMLDYIYNYRVYYFKKIYFVNKLETQIGVLLQAIFLGKLTYEFTAANGLITLHFNYRVNIQV